MSQDKPVLSPSELAFAIRKGRVDGDAGPWFFKSTELDTILSALDRQEYSLMADLKQKLNEPPQAVIAPQSGTAIEQTGPASGSPDALQHEADRLRGWLGEALDRWYHCSTTNQTWDEIVADDEKIAQIRKDAGLC